MSGPAGTPGRKKRENNFHEPGVRGRKTGLVLKDTGIRDKDGLEPIEGIFSSPEKAANHTNSRKSNATLTESEDMEVGQSSAPEPMDLLTGRKLARESQSGRPPPHGRSPIKTNIGATPRRQSSMGPASSPQRRTPVARASSQQPTVNRLLDFSMEESRLSVESSGGQRAVLQSRRSVIAGLNDLIEMEGDEDVPDDVEDAADASATNGLEDEEVQINGTNDDSPAPMMMDDDMISMNGDDYLGETQAETIQEASQAAEEEEEEAPATKRGRGRGRPSNVSTTSVNDDSSAVSAAENVPKRRGRPPKSQAPPAAPDAEPEVEERPRKRTRLSLLQAEAETQAETVADPDVGDEEQGAEPQAPKVKDKAKKGKKVPPSQKDSNAKITSKSAKDAKMRKDGFKTPRLTRGNQRIREETPMEDEGAQHTRSGRLSYKPLGYWKGERAVYSVEAVDGVQKPVPVQTVQGLIRMEDVTPMKRASQKRPRKKQKVSVYQDDEQEEEAEEPWELEEGIITGPVRMWDVELSQGIDEGAEQEIAYAASRIEARDVAEASFRFAKTLTMPFFGSGIVELPPGGFKHRKNTRRMQMVFFVHYGKVTVEVGGTRFVITKGGMWQVPRGNFYSISNETEQPAKIFFSQGCEVVPEPADSVDPGLLEPQPA